MDNRPIGSDAPRQPGATPPPTHKRAVLLKAALVAPVLAVVLGAILAHGLYFAVIHHVEHLTTDIAQAAVAGRTQDDRQRLALDKVDTAIEAYPLLRRDRLTVNVTPAADDPGVYHVTLVYDARHIGLIWSLADFVPLPSPRIQHSSTIRPGGH